MTHDWRPKIELWGVKNPQVFVGGATIEDVDECEVRKMCRERYFWASNVDEIYDKDDEDNDFTFLCIATATWRSYLREVANAVAEGFDDSLAMLPEIGDDGIDVYPARWCTDKTDPDNESPDTYLFFMADTDGYLRSWY